MEKCKCGCGKEAWPGSPYHLDCYARILSEQEKERSKGPFTPAQYAGDSREYDSPAHYQSAVNFERRKRSDR